MRGREPAANSGNGYSQGLPTFPKLPDTGLEPPGNKRAFSERKYENGINQKQLKQNEVKSVAISQPECIRNNSKLLNIASTFSFIFYAISYAGWITSLIQRLHASRIIVHGSGTVQL